MHNTKIVVAMETTIYASLFEKIKVFNAARFDVGVVNLEVHITVVALVFVNEAEGVAYFMQENFWLDVEIVLYIITVAVLIEIEIITKHP